MNAYKELEIEIDGIESIVKSYTNRGDICNYLSKLKLAIANNDRETILYCLKNVCDWYGSNISSILSNQYVYDKEKHRKNKALVEHLYQEIKNTNQSVKTDRSKQIAFENKDNHSKDVFIVHGHDTNRVEAIENFLRSLKLNPIVLFKEADGGKTIIEKIESYSEKVSYCIVLYTKCDVGNAAGQDDKKKFRARQNVVFEHGYMIGRLGRKNVCALLESNEIETPGDIDGIVYVTMDKEGVWKYKIAKNMKECGIKVDLNDLK